MNECCKKYERLSHRLVQDELREAAEINLELARIAHDRLQEAEKVIDHYASEWNQINPKKAREYKDKYSERNDTHL